MLFSGKSKTFCLIVLDVLLILCLSGCLFGASDGNESLSDENINLIFVVSSDLAYNGPGDINPDTANLTSQGLQRALRMGTYLKNHVLGGENVTSIYALSPMTHLQTVNNYPDMTAIGSIQHFALLNRHTVAIPPAAGYSSYTANSYPIKVSYGDGSVPGGVVVPDDYCPDCIGLDFNDMKDNNVGIATGIIYENNPGFYVFSAPWETSSALMDKINRYHGLALDIPANYSGPDVVYVISISPDGKASLIIYESYLNPPSTYPELPSPIVRAPCTYLQQPYSKISVAGTKAPANINKSETVYIVRHAEAHPDPKHGFENGNFVGAGQWRALDLPNAFSGKISPDMVYSCDPAQWYSTEIINPSDYINVSYVRPSLTVWPYAIANNLPYHLVSSFLVMKPNQAKNASDFFFTGGTFTGKSILLAWESTRIKPIINKLLESYGLAAGSLLNENWPVTDYNTIWTVTIDASGNLTVENGLCEGIDSNALPEQAPHF
ncbi:hypothetical protein SAMN05660337_1745 [Maridesulfovibrio ferrireducens]|uniref:Uncharacterized protein n=1 Tax=Maridesulfovibrio ferrireducens TaxID=246191 RepID=A0A1G9FXH8_9BACT|nr:hypothetical protein [Maridesulfovibrio ferrireducens]SDK93057.1 hypothetical protein SAMN05660337_1745 [Maridesulfovibrio ferrireducens]